MALTKADLAEALFNELGLNKREAKEFVEFFFEKIREALENGEAVKLSGFGITAGARVLLAQTEVPKPGQLYSLAILQGLADFLKKEFNEFLGFSLV